MHAAFGKCTPCRTLCKPLQINSLTVTPASFLKVQHAWMIKQFAAAV
jgi:hypothetical protein